MADDDIWGDWSWENFRRNRSDLLGMVLGLASAAGVCVAAVHQVGGTLGDLGPVILPWAVGAALPFIQLFATPPSRNIGRGTAIALTYAAMIASGLVGGFQGGGPFFEVIGVAVVYGAVPTLAFVLLGWALRHRRADRSDGSQPSAPDVSTGAE